MRTSVQCRAFGLETWAWRGEARTQAESATWRNHSSFRRAWGPHIGKVGAIVLSSPRPRQEQARPTLGPRCSCIVAHQSGDRTSSSRCHLPSAVPAEGTAVHRSGFRILTIHDQDPDPIIVTVSYPGADRYE